MRRTDGFTLLELLVVISIVGLLSSIAVPMMGQSLKEWKTNQFSRNLLTAQNTARFHAISKQRHIQVRYYMAEEKVTFYICGSMTIAGDCKDDSWKPFSQMNALRADKESVDLWSVGDLESGIACMYYKPDGSIHRPLDASGTNDKCNPSMSKIGSGVHVTWKPNPDETQESEHCKWNTVFHISSGTGKPTLIRYGAYPTSSGPFQHTLDNEPSCA